jgi:predicted lipoprotein with Yx(FWY)xxD motif
MRSHLMLCATTFATVAALAAPGAAGATSTPLVGTARNGKLHHTVLVNGKGLTLYALSAERSGRLICTDKTCLSFWTPLVVPRGARPTGTVKSLATIRRRDGKRQVTYRGRPLDTFNDDRRRGDAMGEGFKDVGIWHAVVARS